MPKVIKGLVLIALGALLIGEFASRLSAQEKVTVDYPGQVSLLNKVAETAEITVRMDKTTVVKEKLTSASSVRIRKGGMDVPVTGLDEGEQVTAKYQVAKDGKKILVEINVITQ